MVTRIRASPEVSQANLTHENHNYHNFFYQNDGTNHMNSLSWRLVGGDKSLTHQHSRSLRGMRHNDIEYLICQNPNIINTIHKYKRTSWKWWKLKLNDLKKGRINQEEIKAREQLTHEGWWCGTLFCRSLIKEALFTTINNIFYYKAFTSSNKYARYNYRTYHVLFIYL